MSTDPRLMGDRPVNARGERVLPSNLLEYRALHEFLGPCCLCAASNPTKEAAFTESSIFVSSTGPQAGEYVAACAKGECGYRGACNSDLILYKVLCFVTLCGNSVS